MDVIALLPVPEAIPAPRHVFEALDIAGFVVHLIFINIVVGGVFIALASRLRDRGFTTGGGAHGPAINSIPTALALGINFGVAPLLFTQLLYGHLLYTSSVLMAVFWILVIPLLLIGYYCAYIYTHNDATSPRLSFIALCTLAIILLYIPFIFVNNMTLMLHPEKWTGYFSNRGGTMLNLSDPTIVPRYLHFLAASVAVAGLFSALIWRRRAANGAPSASHNIAGGLRIYAAGTVVQMCAGAWLLLSLPRDIMIQFLGANAAYTAILALGIIAAFASLVTALRARPAPTAGLLCGVIVLMAVSRANLRTAYLAPFFSTGNLAVTPQYGAAILFFAVFAAGITAITYMLKMTSPKTGRA